MGLTFGRVGRGTWAHGHCDGCGIVLDFTIFQMPHEHHTHVACPQCSHRYEIAAGRDDGMKPLRVTVGRATR
jgi:Zn finger protein HypA/HybF involved in hydrogenase expression